VNESIQNVETKKIEKRPKYSDIDKDGIAKMNAPQENAHQLITERILTNSKRKTLTRFFFLPSCD
jgi:hypothetical protein